MQNAQCHLILIHPLSYHKLNKTVIRLDSTGKTLSYSLFLTIKEKIYRKNIYNLAVILPRWPIMNARRENAKHTVSFDIHTSIIRS